MPEPNSRSEAYDVTVIGCGLMGSALARQFAKAGYRVAAWNRTLERAEALEDDGVTPMRSVDEAVHSSPLVVACTSTYETTLSALEPVASWDGITLANLANGTPEEALDLERWFSARGAEYLEGGIFAYPQDIGLASTSIYYAGPVDVWSTHERTLMALGGASRHVSEEIKTANVMFTGMLAFYLPAMSAYLEAATYLASEGVTIPTLREISVPPLHTITYMTEEAAVAMESGQFESDQATIDILLEACRIGLGALQGAGHPVRHLAATIANLEAGEAAGLGELGFYSLTKILGSTNRADVGV